MFLLREILTVVKARDAYDALTDTSLYIAHFVEVAEDATQNIWENVIRWLNICFDLVEEGQAILGDMTMERKRMTVEWRAAMYLCVQRGKVLSPRWPWCA